MTLNNSTWNVEWAPPGSKRADSIRALLSEHVPEVVCLTECVSGLLSGGHVIEAHADYGYSHTDTRRKVLLWSRSPWRGVCRGEHSSFPSGRLISGTTETSIGVMRIIGVCIPWRNAPVRTGRRDKKPWEDHLQFLHALRAYIADHGDRTIILGDFNQRVPRSGQPEEVFQALMHCFDHRRPITTVGLVDANGATAIDHLAVSADLRINGVEILPKIDAAGIRLPDHFGFTCQVAAPYDPSNTMSLGSEMSAPDVAVT